MGRNLQPAMEKIKISSIGLLGILIMGMLSFSVSSDILNKKGDIVGVIIPHHMIVSAKIDELLAGLAKENNFTRIIILSPNHFNYGFHYIQTTNDNLGSLRANLGVINQLNAGQTAVIENKDFQKEHGIMSEIPLIEKYWPAARIIPVTIKTATPEWRLKKLAHELTGYAGAKGYKNEKTLIIASLDFSHYCTEETAKKNDRRFTDWIAAHSNQQNNTDNNTSDKTTTAISLDQIKKLAVSFPDISKTAIAIDSAETFYTFWLIKSGLELNNYILFARTSGAEITGSRDPLQNTSHIFAIFK
jgi:AmmeMemoRadiSam system protein B